MSSQPQTRSEGEPRRRLSAQQRRESILAAANQVFGERGYEHVRIDDIAAGAGISKALIYEHFRSKSELYKELMSRAAAELGGRIVDAATRPGAQGSDRLAGATAALFDFVDKQPDSFHMFIRDVTDPEIASHQEALRAGFVSALTDIMEMEPPQAREGLDRPKVEQIAEMLWAGLFAMGKWALRHPQAERRELAAMVMSFMWLGLGPMQAGERWPLSNIPSAQPPNGR